jgi:hypothetical protein
MYYVGCAGDAPIAGLGRHGTHPVELAIFPESLHVKVRLISAAVPLRHDSLADGHGWRGFDASFAWGHRSRRQIQRWTIQSYSYRRVFRDWHLIKILSCSIEVDLVLKIVMRWE